MENENKKPEMTEQEKSVAKFKEDVKEAVVNDTLLTPEQEELLEKCLEEAKMPVKLTDEEFKLGEQELDIRGLKKANKDQMMFRMQILNVVYQRQITQNLVDLERLMMLILKKLGVEDIVKETDELLEELKSNVLNNSKKDKNQVN